MSNKIQTIVAVERDGLNVHAVAINLNILSEDQAFNVRQAVIDACTEFVQTEAGKRTYDYNCRNFNWADFESDVPNEICRKHGFEKLESFFDAMEVDWDEHLVDDTQLSSENKEE